MRRPKGIKTRKAAAKRVKITGTGKILRNRPGRRHLATSKTAKEAFAKLFFESFSLPLELADPLQRGLRADLSPDQRHALERAEPVRWPNTTQRSGAARAAASPLPQAGAAEAATSADAQEESR